MALSWLHSFDHSGLRDIRVWGGLFLVLSLLALGLAVWQGYQSHDSQTLLSESAFTQPHGRR